ncbi:MAG TPA: hypothetical protein VK973_11785, partial [Arenicellales bacterium]|nr:hypothetical protein [Arenicellales bacterium]
AAQAAAQGQAGRRISTRSRPTLPDPPGCMPLPHDGMNAVRRAAAAVLFCRQQAETIRNATPQVET